MICNIFYNHWGQSGLIDGYWNLEVKTVKLEAGIEYDFLMKKLYQRGYPSNKNVFQTSKSRTQTITILNAWTILLKPSLEKNLVPKEKNFAGYLKPTTSYG